MRYRKILFVFGTRPEAIKLAPLIKEFKKHRDRVAIDICITGQHREMLDQVLDFFDLHADYDLNIMKSDQSLFDITSVLVKGMEKVLEDSSPDLIFVQGDTTTAFVGALAGFYEKIKVAHVEAGLRSFNKFSPFPEEINRVLISRLVDFHFAPTQEAKDNLLNEGVKENIWVVGNTVIDALHLGLKILSEKRGLKEEIERFFSTVIKNHTAKLILVTGHRRESFGKPFENMCFALKDIVESCEDVEVVYPVHLNPNVREPVFRILGKHPRIHLIEPLSYPYLIYLLEKSYLVLTDSGGIQEEAPSLGKPVLVMREVTERQEGVEAGVAKLVGTDRGRIVKETLKLLEDKGEYKKMSRAINPYGDGRASIRIAEVFGLTKN